MKKRQITIIQMIMTMCFLVMANCQLVAQSRIELNSTQGNTHISESSLNGLEIKFSYSTIETEPVETGVGSFSKLVLSDAVPCGEIGAPSLPVSRKLIAVPVGATPSVKTVGFTTSDYKLEDYGVKRVYPQQPSYSKSTKMEDVVFQYDKKAYKKRSLTDAPKVTIELLGTMRGVQIASLQVEPISYDPVNNTLRVYNDIELDVENEYIMSPKDLCTIGFIDKILAAGVEVLKIEGRARPPEYVKLVTEVYHEAVKAVEEGCFNAEKAEKWKERLSEVFNRGFWDGYYLGQRLGEWNNMHGSKAKYHKEFVGTVNNFFSRLSVAEIYINSGKISVGERVLIIGPTTGTIDMTISEIRFDDRKSDTAVKGDVISIPVPEKVRRSDKLYVLVEN